jgi:hypothetical protein
MTIETLAEKYRLKITRDECNDKIIEGKHGQLYVDAGTVCAMWLYARVGEPLLAGLGSRIWVGDYALDRGRRLRDAKVTGIPPENIPRAIRLCGIKKKRIMSEAQQAVLARATANSPIGRKGTQP